MKFKVIDHYEKETRWSTLRYAILESVCGKYTKNSFNFRNESIGTIVSTFNIDCFERLKRRLYKIGINVEFSANLPWIYLSKVNGVYVDGYKNCEHGFCIGYSSSPCNLSYRKDCFNKIREMINK